MTDFSGYLDQVFSFYSNSDFYERLSAGKASFVEFAGPFDEDRIDIESKWVQFRDWYLYDFVFNGKTCVELFRESSLDIVSADIKEAITNARSGVFYFYKQSRGRIYLRDLFARDKIQIRDSEVSLGLEKDEYIQTRVFDLDKSFHFGAHLTAHPPEGYKYIDTKIKPVRKEKNLEKKVEMKSELLNSLLRKYFQIQRFKQVDIRKIYSDDSLFEKKREERL